MKPIQQANLMEDEYGNVPSEEELARCREQIARDAEWREAVARRDAAIEAAYQDIDEAIAPYVEEELAAVNKAPRVSPAVKKDFEAFRAYCARYRPPLPHLPARGQAVAAFIASQLDRGNSKRLSRSISAVHRAVGMPDPTSDALVQAVLRMASKSPSHQQQEPTNANL